MLDWVKVVEWGLYEVAELEQEVCVGRVGAVVVVGSYSQVVQFVFGFLYT